MEQIARAEAFAHCLGSQDSFFLLTPVSQSCILCIYVLYMQERLHISTHYA